MTPGFAFGQDRHSLPAICFSFHLSVFLLTLSLEGFFFFLTNHANFRSNMTDRRVSNLSSDSRVVSRTPGALNENQLINRGSALDEMSRASVAFGEALGLSTSGVNHDLLIETSFYSILLVVTIQHPHQQMLSTQQVLRKSEKSLILVYRLLMLRDRTSQFLSTRY